MMNTPSGTTKLPQIGARLKAEFDDAENRRQPFVERWIDNLRQFRGKHEAGETFHEKRSKHFYRITRRKVKSTVARLMEILFPGSGEANWGIEPTPVPSVDLELAREAAKNMEQEIADQLAEAPNRVSFRSICRRLLTSGCLYGPGILKGPITTIENRIAWVQSVDPMTGMPGPWRRQQIQTLRPYFEFVPVWDAFPDLGVVDQKDQRFFWQTHERSIQELRDLAKQPDFDEEAILAYILEHPDGDVTPMRHEAPLKALNDQETTKAQDKKKRYRLYERWGSLTGKECAELGLAITPDEFAEEKNVQVWLIGDRVIKFVETPSERLRLPYYIWNFDKDETSLLGEGLPSIMKDEQRAVNAAIRGLIDHASITVGPQLSVNMSALDGETDPYDITPFKVWGFHSAVDMKEAFQVWSLPSSTAEFQELVGFFKDAADEMTLPAYQYGDNRVQGAGETASGLSMLMGASNIDISELVKSFDDEVTSPFISAMYDWNMLFNDKPEIKGDYAVKPLGSSVLMSREIMAQRIIEAISVVGGNPMFQPFIKAREVLEQLFKSFGIDPDTTLKSEIEVQQEQMLMAQQQMMLAAGAPPSEGPPA